MGALIVGVLATEAAYRVLARFVCISAPPRLYEQRDWGWTHRPNAASWTWGCLGREFEYRTWVEINSHGLRDREIDYDRPPSRQRVLVLGDSMTAALQVPLEETFAKLVERRLGASGRDVDVVNAGHAGFGTDNEILFFEHEGSRYRPDLVVLAFNFQNDVAENSQTLAVRTAQATNARLPRKQWYDVGVDGRIVPLPPPPGVAEDDWSSRLMSEFYLLRAFDRIVSGRATPQFDLTLYYGLYGPLDDTWTRAWVVTEALLRRLRTVVERAGARFAIVLLPSKEMVWPEMLMRSFAFWGVSPAGYDVERPHAKMAAFLTAERIPFVDLLPVMRKTPLGTGFLGWDPHLDRNGNAEVATAMAPLVVQQLDLRSAQ
jgi:hypothetical protein